MGKLSSFTKRLREEPSLFLLILFFLIPFAVVFLVHQEIPSLEEVLQLYYTSGTSYFDLLYAVLKGLILFVSGIFYVILLLIGSALLFDVTWNRKKVLKSRALWQIYLGYFLLIVLLLSMFASEILANWHPRLWGTAGAPVLIVVGILTGFTILASRILSKLPLKIEDTNLGSFVIVIYISYGVFKLLSQSFNPLVFWFSALTVEPARSLVNAFFLISLPAVFGFVIALLDTRIIKRTGKRKLLEKITGETKQESE
jgi:hypothetical protein